MGVIKFHGIAAGPLLLESAVQLLQSHQYLSAKLLVYGLGLMLNGVVISNVNLTSKLLEPSGGLFGGDK